MRTSPLQTFDGPGVADHRADVHNPVALYRWASRGLRPAAPGDVFRTGTFTRYSRKLCDLAHKATVVTQDDALMDDVGAGVARSRRSLQKRQKCWR